MSVFLHFSGLLWQWQCLETRGWIWPTEWTQARHPGSDPRLPCQRQKLQQQWAGEDHLFLGQYMQLIICLHTCMHVLHVTSCCSRVYRFLSEKKDVQYLFILIYGNMWLRMLFGKTQNQMRKISWDQKCLVPQDWTGLSLIMMKGVKVSLILVRLKP